MPTYEGRNHGPIASVTGDYRQGDEGWTDYGTYQTREDAMARAKSLNAAYPGRVRIRRMGGTWHPQVRHLK